MSELIGVLICRHCHGSGTRITLEPCPWCDGTGSITFKIDDWAFSIEKSRSKIPDCPNCKKEMDHNRLTFNRNIWRCSFCNYEIPFKDNPPDPTDHIIHCAYCNHFFRLSTNETPDLKVIKCPWCKKEGMYFPVHDPDKFHRDGNLTRVFSWQFNQGDKIKNEISERIK